MPKNGVGSVQTWMKVSGHKKSKITLTVKMSLCKLEEDSLTRKHSKAIATVTNGTKMMASL